MHYVFVLFRTDCVSRHLRSRDHGGAHCWRGIFRRFGRQTAGWAMGRGRWGLVLRLWAIRANRSFHFFMFGSRAAPATGPTTTTITTTINRLWNIKANRSFHFLIGSGPLTPIVPFTFSCLAPEPLLRLVVPASHADLDQDHGTPIVIFR